mgnify:CR=1 FL=1
MPTANAAAKRSSSTNKKRVAAKATESSPYPSTPRVSPHSLDAEQAVLACCLLEGGQDTLSRCLEQKIAEYSFYNPKHQTMFRAMVELHDEQVAIDEVTLGEKLSAKNELDSIGGYPYISEVASRIDTPAHLPHYIRRVRDTYILRNLIHTCQNTVEEAFSQQEDIAHFLNEVEQKVFRLSEESVNESALSDSPTMMDAASRQINFYLNHRGEVTGVPSGFKDLDSKTTGFHAPQMVVVAARPGMGKTSMALNMAESAMLGAGHPEKAIPTLMFSLEMGSEELALRLLCSHARVNTEKLKAGFIESDRNKELSDSHKKLSAAPFYVDDSPGLNILEMRAKARRIKSKKNIGLVIVDYLQLLSGTDPSVPRHEQIAEISRGLKAMAKELGIPVLALAQLNRETEKERRPPRMSDLRESGSIEQDADIVLLIAPRLDKGEDANDGSNVLPRDLIIAKQRNGPTGKVALTFNTSITRFENAANI